jgi:hypothetical protein
MRIDDNTVTIVLIVVAGLVVALAIWFGRGLKARKTKAGYELEVQSQPADAAGGIQVARGAKITGSTVGDIAGVKVEGGGAAGPVPDRIQVFDQGTLKNVQAGDIAGVKKTTPPKSAP